MYDFGDEWVIDINGIPWGVICIQILVMFLLALTILFTYFEVFALDSSAPSTADSLTSSSSPVLDPPSTFCQTNQDKITSSSRTGGLDDNSEKDGSSLKELVPAKKTTKHFFVHPCRYLDIATQAFLKCLGLSLSHRNSPARDKKYDD